MGYLLQMGRIAAAEILLLAGLVLLTAFLLWYGWRLVSQPHRSVALLEKLAGFWNRLASRFGWRRLHPEALESRLEAFHEGLVELHNVPRWKFLAATAGRTLLDVASLGACFAALGHLNDDSTDPESFEFSPESACWCSRTVTVLGPDDILCSLEMCQPGRSCFEAR